MNYLHHFTVSVNVIWLIGLYFIKIDIGTCLFDMKQSIYENNKIIYRMKM